MKFKKQAKLTYCNRSQIRAYLLVDGGVIMTGKVQKEASVVLVIFYILIWMEVPLAHAFQKLLSCIFIICPLYISIKNTSKKNKVHERAFSNNIYFLVTVKGRKLKSFK